MATPAEADDSILKRRARRRLIGAIALALVAVIVLPIVFEAERKPLDADISIQIPNKDVLVTKGPGALNVPGDGNAPAPGGKADTKADVKPEIKADAKASAAAKAAEAYNAKDLVEEKRAAAILNAQAAAAAGTPTKASAVEGAFAVQVGAFVAEDKVKEVRDKLSAAGIKTYTEKLDTKDGERTRVRAGPFAGREAADAAREQVRGLGFANANVVPR